MPSRLPASPSDFGDTFVPRLRPRRLQLAGPFSLRAKRARRDGGRHQQTYPIWGSDFAACVSLATKPNSCEHAIEMKQRLGRAARFLVPGAGAEPSVWYCPHKAKPKRMVVTIGPILPEGRAWARDDLCRGGRLPV